MNQTVERALDDNPIHQAWRKLTDSEPMVRLPVLARILTFNLGFNPHGLGLTLFHACLDEILNDPDTYPDDLQTWAQYHLEDAQVAFGD